MKFLQGDPCIQEGDTVIIFLNHKLSYYVAISRGQTFQTKYGALRHDYVIDKPFGTKVQLQRGFVHVLRPTPESWAANLEHRTQILYPPDINVIVLALDLRPGSVVVEAGTGSGALSHALARCIAPSGKLYTFEINEERTRAAAKEFEDHGFCDVIQTAHRDICSQGIPDTVACTADAVFLDLPTPWDALPAAKRAFKQAGGRLGLFSPCVEQVHRSLKDMEDLGFISVEVFTTNALQLKSNEVKLPSPEEFFRRRSKPPGRSRNSDEPPEPKIQKLDEEATATPIHSGAESACLKVYGPEIYPRCQNVHSGYLVFATLLPIHD